MVANVPMVKSLVDRLLDDGYEQATLSILRAFAAEANGGALGLRLAQLEIEAARLAREGLRLTADNPLFSAILNDLDGMLARNAQRLRDISGQLILDGVRVAEATTAPLAFGVAPGTNLGLIGVNWNRPDPATIAELIGIVDDPIFRAEVEAYQKNVFETARNYILREVALGRHPEAIGRGLARLIREYSTSQATNFMRTLQLVSYRRATAAQQRANVDIIETVIRIAVLDRRTCMACIAEHGSELRIGEVVIDHHQGRCTSITVIKGRPQTIRTGPDWFDLQDSEMQRAMMGDKAYEAWRAGRFDLRDYVGRYESDLFGEMLREKSLKELLKK